MIEQPAVGEEWIYRRRDDEPSERVRIVSLSEPKQYWRAVVEFLDGERAGSREDVPGRRLKGRWSAVEAYHRALTDRARLDSYELTAAEEGASERAFLLLIPAEVAWWGAVGSTSVSAVDDPAALQSLTGLAWDELVSRVESLEDGDSVLVSNEGTVLIAEHACRRSPTPILNWVAANERTFRERCNGQSVPSENGYGPVSPEMEYAIYLERARPVHELLRQWCGHRAVGQHERLAAAEAEVHRLDHLMARAVAALGKAGAASMAAALDREHEEERITPGTIRPVVDRPLKPSEIPVQVVYRHRRWP